MDFSPPDLTAAQERATPAAGATAVLAGPRRHLLAFLREGGPAHSFLTKGPVVGTRTVMGEDGLGDPVEMEEEVRAPPALAPGSWPAGAAEGLIPAAPRTDLWRAVCHVANPAEAAALGTAWEDASRGGMGFTPFPGLATTRHVETEPARADFLLVRPLRVSGQGGWTRCPRWAAASWPADLRHELSVSGLGGVSLELVPLPVAPGVSPPPSSVFTQVAVRIRPAVGGWIRTREWCASHELVVEGPVLPHAGMWSLAIGPLAGGVVDDAAAQFWAEARQWAGTPADSGWAAPDVSPFGDALGAVFEAPASWAPPPAPMVSRGKWAVVRPYPPPAPPRPPPPSTGSHLPAGSAPDATSAVQPGSEGGAASSRGGCAAPLIPRSLVLARSPAAARPAAPAAVYLRTAPPPTAVESVTSREPLPSGAPATKRRRDRSPEPPPQPAPFSFERPPGEPGNLWTGASGAAAPSAPLPLFGSPPPVSVLPTPAALDATTPVPLPTPAPPTPSAFAVIPSPTGVSLPAPFPAPVVASPPPPTPPRPGPESPSLAPPPPTGEQGRPAAAAGEDFPPLVGTGRVEAAARGRRAYVVFIGRKPGVYDTWEEAEAQVKNFTRARHRGYASRAEAEAAFSAAKAGAGSRATS
jgi:hypothetical protein